MPSIDRRRFLKAPRVRHRRRDRGRSSFTAFSAKANVRDRHNALRAVPDLRDGKVRL